MAAALDELIDSLPPERREQARSIYDRACRRTESADVWIEHAVRGLVQRAEKPRELTSQQQKAIELLLSGERESKVAEELGIHRSTLWRWRQRDEDFRRTFDLARERAFRGATDRLRELVPRSLDILEEELERGSYQAAARLLRLARVDRGQSGL
jgi:transposase-like protein